MACKSLGYRAVGKTLALKSGNNLPMHLTADAEAEAPILWPPDAKSQFIGKDSDAGKDGRQKEKGLAEDEMVR